jgi:endonuclease/exonuclease/phosphatase family metal-dependent hydrolase
VRALAACGMALLLCACTHLAAGPADPAGTLAAMTFNIRLDLDSDGANAWPHRRAMVADLIRREEPAVLGLQEVLLHQKKDLEAALPGYAFVGVARDDGAEKGEFSPLAFRRDRFSLLESGTFWLSPTPSVPGKAWDAALPRVATWAILAERGSGLRIAALNTHFDHVGTAARANSAALIGDWSARRIAAGDAVIIMGDFNSTPGSPPMALLGDPARSGVAMARTASVTPPYGPPGTFTGFRIDSDPAAPIDHVLVSSRFSVLRYATVTQHWGGRLPSDHYPVVADLRLRR